MNPPRDGQIAAVDSFFIELLSLVLLSPEAPIPPARGIDAGTNMRIVRQIAPNKFSVGPICLS